MALKGREIRLSLRDEVKSLLESPPAATGLSAFNVYTEAQMRDTDFSPTFPFAFLVDSHVEPVQNRLPLIVLEVAKQRLQSAQLGDRSGRRVTAHFNVFGDNRGERDDLADLIADNIGPTITLKTFSASDPTGTAVETVVLEDKIDIVPMLIGGDDVEFSGAIIDWARVTIYFQTLT